MPRIHPSVSRLLTFAILMTSAFADTVTLKSGEHLEGKITKETDSDITMEVQVSAGITDERVVPKSEIDKVDKLTPELAAFQALAKVQLAANSLAATDYDRYITALQSYITQFPDSSRVSDVKTILDAFQAEKKRVEGGEVKIDGEWLSKAEAEKESVQIHGRLALAYMKSESAASDVIGALNTFAALEKNYPGAAVMPDAIELAIQLATGLKAAVEREIPIQKEMKAEHDKSVAAAGPAQRAEILAASKKEDEMVNASITAAESGGRWPTYIRSNELSLTTLSSHAAREITRMVALPVGKMRQSLQLTESAKQSLASGDLDTASETVKQATTLWTANELAVRLAKQIDGQKAQVKAVATPTPTPRPATPVPTPRPSAALQATPPPDASASTADDDKPFIMTLPGAISVVVGLAVVLVGANVYIKMKKKKAEQAQ